jgi:MFS family permease
MGMLGTYVSIRAIYVAAGVLCLPALLALSQIRPEEIDYIRARNATKVDHAFSRQRLTDLGKNRTLLVFACCMVLFQLANASLLPLVSQNLAHDKLPSTPLFMAALLIASQVVVAALAPWIGYWSELWGRKPLLLVGFAMVALRALLFAFVADPWFLIAIQVLDGVTGAIVTVLSVLVMTDITTGTGRFNLAQGAIGAAMVTAAAFGTGAAGFIASRFGDLTGFLSMAAIAVGGTGLLWSYFPETKPPAYVD